MKLRTFENLCRSATETVYDVCCDGKTLDIFRFSWLNYSDKNAMKRIELLQTTATVKSFFVLHDGTLYITVNVKPNEWKDEMNIDEWDDGSIMEYDPDPELELDMK